MNIQDIHLLYGYNYWANGKIQAAAANLAPEQFTAPAAHSYGSLRGTLVHLLDGEYSWRMLCQHNQMTFDLREADFPTLDVLLERWREEEAAMRAYLAGLSDEGVLGLVRYTTDSGLKRERVLWHCLVHVVNHGTQHRSEAAAILTSLGHSPGDVDFTLFLNERGEAGGRG
jgi:uncharacterized damage-inducible protein DinB